MHSEHMPYYPRFVAANNAGSSTVFVEFMLEAILSALKEIGGIADPIADREQRILEFFSFYPKATTPELATVLECSVATAERSVTKLREDGALIRHGSPRTGTWEVFIQESP